MKYKPTTTDYVLLLIAAVVILINPVLGESVYFLGAATGIFLSVCVKLWFPEKKQKFTYKGKHYFIEEFAEMKDSTSREWLPCVIYVQIENGEKYIREEEEFWKLFRPVN